MIRTAGARELYLRCDVARGTAAFTNAGGTDLPEGYAAMVFNAASVDNGKLTGGTAQAQAFIILHELGHAMGATDFRDDFKNSANGKHNDDLIDTKCKKTLGAIK